jgi:hypothetical protein
LITKLSPAQQAVMDLLDQGMTCRQAAEKLGISLVSACRKRDTANYKRRVARGVITAPPTVRNRDEEETEQEIRERIAVDIALGLRCQHCHVVLEGSDCEESGSCVARSPDLLRGDAMERIRALWNAVELGHNAKSYAE